MARWPELGARLRSERLRLGFTLDDLASRAGVSKSYLSRIEHGERRPSLPALMRLASELATTVDDLVAASLAPESPVRTPDLPFALTPIGGTPGGALESFRVRLHPVPRPGNLVTHPGEEFLYVVEGTLQLQIGDDVDVVPTGNTAHFNATQPHWFGAGKGAPATLMIVTGGVGPGEDSDRSAWHRGF